MLLKYGIVYHILLYHLAWCV